jgi:sugar phosphate permease
MYLITYLDRVNISTAAPQISKEFGFDKVTMGVIFRPARFAAAKRQWANSQLLVGKSLLYRSA